MFRVRKSAKSARRGAERRQAPGDERGREQLADRHPAADPRDAVVRVDPSELAELADVDEQRRLTAALAEIDQEIGAAREGLRRGVLREERCRLEERRRVPVLEPRQEHR